MVIVLLFLIWFIFTLFLCVIYFKNRERNNADRWWQNKLQYVYHWRTNRNSYVPSSRSFLTPPSTSLSPSSLLLILNKILIFLTLILETTTNKSFETQKTTDETMVNGRSVVLLPGSELQDYTFLCIFSPPPLPL